MRSEIGFRSHSKAGNKSPPSARLRRVLAEGGRGRKHLGMGLGGFPWNGGSFRMQELLLEYSIVAECPGSASWG